MEQEHSNLEKTLLALVCDKCNQTLPNNYDKSNENDQMIDTLEYQDLDLNEIKDVAYLMDTSTKTELFI